MKKYQIFISSTYDDLKEERKAVINTILTMQHFPVGMEFFGARNEDQWAHIENDLRSSDYYILILKQKYGTIIEEGVDKGISWTEKEFRFAESIGLPILSFIISEDAPIKKSEIDIEASKIRKLKAFKTLAAKDRLVVWWHDKQELCTKISTALTNEFQSRDKRPGWVRSIEKYSDSYISSLEEKIKELEEIIEQKNDDIKAYKRSLGIEESSNMDFNVTARVNKEISYYRNRYHIQILSLESGSILFISDKLLSGEIIDVVKVLNIDSGKYLMAAFHSGETISFVKEIANYIGLIDKSSNYFCYTNNNVATEDSDKLCDLNIQSGDTIKFQSC